MQHHAPYSKIITGNLVAPSQPRSPACAERPEKDEQIALQTVLSWSLGTMKTVVLRFVWEPGELQWRRCRREAM